MLKLNSTRKVWFMSDPHFYHKNIVRGVSRWPDKSKTRDFETVEEMNETIFTNINRLVGEDDVLIILGDFSFDGIDKIKLSRERINCKEIHLILGNHDYHLENNNENCQQYFTSVHMNLMVEYDDRIKYKFLLSHHPYCSWLDMRNGSMHLFGHLHMTTKDKLMRGRSQEVGIEGNNLCPYLVDDIIKTLIVRPILTNILPEKYM